MYCGEQRLSCYCPSIYLYLSEYLKKKNRIKDSLKILKDGVKVHPSSTELLTQLNHIKILNETKPLLKKKVSRKSE